MIDNVVRPVNRRSFHCNVGEGGEYYRTFYSMNLTRGRRSEFSFLVSRRRKGDMRMKKNFLLAVVSLLVLPVLLSIDQSSTRVQSDPFASTAFAQGDPTSTGSPKQKARSMGGVAEVASAIGAGFLAISLARKFKR
jgi:hypothetical protein